MGLSPTHQWEKKLEASEVRHLKRVRELRREILEDESLDPLDRAVLGMTGSKVELERFQQLAQKIGEHAGQPIVSIDSFDDKRVIKAMAGIVAGEVDVTIRRRDVDPGRVLGVPSFSVDLSVPVNPILSYSSSLPRTRYADANSKFFFNRDTTGQNESGGFINIARFHHSETGNRTKDPLNDLRDSKTNSVLLVGREAIYEHERFAQGVSSILLALEQHQAEVPAKKA